MHVLGVDTLSNKLGPAAISDHFHLVLLQLLVLYTSTSTAALGRRMVNRVKQPNSWKTHLLADPETHRDLLCCLCLVLSKALRQVAAAGRQLSTCLL
jgi:hypothetical protein